MIFSFNFIGSSVTVTLSSTDAEFTATQFYVSNPGQYKTTVSVKYLRDTTVPVEVFLWCHKLCEC